MREIKFRIWNDHSKVMFMPYRYKNGQLLLRMWDGMIVDVYEGVKREQLVEGDRDHLLPLQFTGLKDKNGKEIYEGDILQSEYNSHEKNSCHPVVWRNGEWAVDHQVNDCCKPWRGNLNGHHSSEEVIGNIYENPELLEGRAA